MSGKQIDQGDRFEEARRAAYRYLTYRARTGYEIKEKLLSKGFAPETVERVMEDLREYRMIDDSEYAERFVAKRQADSRAVISVKLRSLGIRESVISRTLEQRDSEAEFRIALALALNRRKRRGESYPLGRIAAFLSRRGFGQEVVERVFRYLEGMESHELDI